MHLAATSHPVRSLRPTVRSTAPAGLLGRIDPARLQPQVSLQFPIEAFLLPKNGLQPSPILREML